MGGSPIERFYAANPETLSAIDILCGEMTVAATIGAATSPMDPERAAAIVDPGATRRNHMNQLDQLRISVATSSDAADVATIYAPYVRDTAITFEYEAPDTREMAARIERIGATHPWLIARDATGAALGYAYASPYYGRAAYAWCVETSIYVDREARGCGIGTALYQELERALTAQGILNLYACVATTSTPDAHLDNGSITFHERRGYHEIGHFPNCGYKFGHWYDTVWMERDLDNHTLPQPAVRPFPQVRAELGI